MWAADGIQHHCIAVNGVLREASLFQRQGPNPYSGSEWEIPCTARSSLLMDWHRGLHVLLLSLTKCLCTTQLKKKTNQSSAPMLLALQRVGVLPFAMSTMKAVLMEVEQSYSRLKQKKKSNLLLVNSRLCQCVADGEDVRLSCPSDIWHTSGGQCCATGAGWCARARAPPRPKAMPGFCWVQMHVPTVHAGLLFTSCLWILGQTQPTHHLLSPAHRAMAGEENPSTTLQSLSHGGCDGKEQWTVFSRLLGELHHLPDAPQRLLGLF